MPVGRRLLRRHAAARLARAGMDERGPMRPQADISGQNRVGFAAAPGRHCEQNGTNAYIGVHFLEIRWRRRIGLLQINSFALPGRGDAVAAGAASRKTRPGKSAKVSIGQHPIKDRSTAGQQPGQHADQRRVSHRSSSGQWPRKPIAWLGDSSHGARRPERRGVVVRLSFRGGPSSRRPGPEGLGTGTKYRIGARAAGSPCASGAARGLVACRTRREAGAKAGF